MASICTSDFKKKQTTSKIIQMKKHGIYIVKGNKTQTKKIYNNGYLLVRYFYQPHSLSFKNKMVNDMNQHFCGGWSLFDLDLSNEALLKRVLEGKKPLGIISEWKEKDLQKYHEKIDTEKYDLGIFEIKKTGAYYLAIAPKGKIKDLFDLEILKNDYRDNGIDINISEVGERSISYYFDDWDAQDGGKIQLWLTGLLLGYPIENTISLYKGGIK